MATSSDPRPSSSALLGRWALFAAAVVGFFLFLPLARPLRRWLAGVEVYGGVHLGHVLVWAVVGIAAGLVCVVLPRIWGTPEGRGRRLGLWLAAGVLLWVVRRGLLAVEWFHIVENSLLALLALWALRPHFPAVETSDGASARRDDGVYLVAAAVAGCVGVTSEIVQWWLPDRVWDLRDIGLNLLVVVVVLILTWGGIQRPGGGTCSARALRWAARGWALIAFLTFLCVSNSRQAIASYRHLIPGGSHLGTGAYTWMKLPEGLNRRWAQGILALLTLALVLASRWPGRRRPGTTSRDR